MVKVLLSLFITGILFGSGPCLASCGPILISYILGTEKNILKGLSAYFLFSFSRIIIYLLFSILIFYLGQFALERAMQGWYKYVIVIGAIYIIFVGLLLIFNKNINSPFFASLQKIFLKREIKNIVLLGLITGLLPCAPLFALLSYVGLISKRWFESLIYGFSFGMGTFLSPLVFLVLLSGSLNRFLNQKRGLYRTIFNSACGLIIIGIGAHLLSRIFY